MKSNDITALHDQTLDELNQKLSELEKDLAKAQLELTVGKLTDLRLPSKLQDDIARVKTVIREEELIAAAQAKLQTVMTEKTEEAETKETKTEEAETKEELLEE